MLAMTRQYKQCLFILVVVLQYFTAFRALIGQGEQGPHKTEKSIFNNDMTKQYSDYCVPSPYMNVIIK